MLLFYDQRDKKAHETRGSNILLWLDDVGARPLKDARPEDSGFLFAGARSLEDYQRLIDPFPRLRDRPAERAPLLQLDTTLSTLAQANLEIPTPRTWLLPLDAPLPSDLTFPLFLRTARSSLKLGGKISKVRNLKELEEEAAELRRLLGWDALILARAWCDFAPAGKGTYGVIPQEIRAWVVDGQAYAWSFHYLNVLPSPKGFPPSATDLRDLGALAERIASLFQSKCLVADFARLKRGGWMFIEAGPGSCAGTAHEPVFKAVATRLQGKNLPVTSNHVGGLFSGRSAN